MAPKHTINHEHQGMLLPPPTIDGSMSANGATVEIEGGIFPKLATHTPSPEVSRSTPERDETIGRLEAERHALDSLALENRSFGNMTKKTNTVSALEGDFYTNDD